MQTGLGSTELGIFNNLATAYLYFCIHPSLSPSEIICFFAHGTTPSKLLDPANNPFFLVIALCLPNVSVQALSRRIHRRVVKGSQATSEEMFALSQP